MKRANDTYSFSKFCVRIIDILYAVAIGNGLIAISSPDVLNLPQNLNNLLSTKFSLFAFALFIVFRDLIKYHQAINERPHKNVSRFVLDILILFVFFFLMKSYDSWQKYILLLLAHFVLSFIWTIREGLEWKSEEKYTDIDAKALKSDLQLDIIVWLYLLMVYILTLKVNFYGWKLLFLLALGLFLGVVRPKELSKNYLLNRVVSFVNLNKRKDL